MNRNFFIVIVSLSIACMFLIFFTMLWEIDTPLQKEPAKQPPRSPYKTYISGVGIIEPSSESIYVGTPVNRIVIDVPVKVGEKVKKGDVLLRLDNRDLQANLKVQEAAYRSALAKLQKLKSFPRPEDLAEAEAALKTAQAELDLTKNQYEMVQQLPDPRAISEEEKKRRYSNYQQAQAKLQQAQANFDKIKLGTWKPDLNIAQHDVEQAKASLESIKTELDRTIIRAPIDATVLQINIHEGEFPPLESFKMPMMVIGNIDDLHLSVSINQLDIPHFQANTPAIAFFQGDGHTQFPLEFVRVEPILVAKQNLTNEISEKIDTRVLKIIYRIKNDHQPLFVGQQMDVFIEAKEL